MTAELLILLHYFKGEATPLRRCLACHFLAPSLALSPVTAAGDPAPGRSGWLRAPGATVGNVPVPTSEKAFLISAVPSLAARAAPRRGTVPTLAVPGMSPAAGRALGRARPPASPCARPLFWWRLFGSRCHRVLLPLRGSNRNRLGGRRGPRLPPITTSTTRPSSRCRRCPQAPRDSVGHGGVTLPK